MPASRSQRFADAVSHQSMHADDEGHRQHRSSTQIVATTASCVVDRSNGLFTNTLRRRRNWLATTKLGQLTFGLARSISTRVVNFKQSSFVQRE